MLDQLQEDGYAVLESVIAPDQVAALIEHFEKPIPVAKLYARRNLLFDDRVQELAASPEIQALVQARLGPGAKFVKGIYFDKVPAFNWKVPWHQDVTITVAEKHETAGFGPWSVKDGVDNVQAPAEVLWNILTVRLHLDDCGPDNGPVRAIPGTHRLGRIPEAEIDGLANGEVVCVVPAGGALLMSPLILHASSPSENPGHRRVVHMEFSAQPLPGNLKWLADEPARMRRS